MLSMHCRYSRPIHHEDTSSDTLNLGNGNGNGNVTLRWDEARRKVTFMLALMVHLDVRMKCDGLFTAG